MFQKILGPFTGLDPIRVLILELLSYFLELLSRATCNGPFQVCWKTLDNVFCT